MINQKIVTANCDVVNSFAKKDSNYGVSFNILMDLFKAYQAPALMLQNHLQECGHSHKREEPVAY